MIGGAISAVVTWRGTNPEKVPSEFKTAHPEDAALLRSRAMKRVATIYAPISFLCLIIALINGVDTFVLLAGINAAIGALSLFFAWHFARAAEDTYVGTRKSGSKNE